MTIWIFPFSGRKSGTTMHPFPLHRLPQRNMTPNPVAGFVGSLSNFHKNMYSHLGLSNRSVGGCVREGWGAHKHLYLGIYEGGGRTLLQLIPESELKLELRVPTTGLSERMPAKQQTEANFCKLKWLCATTTQNPFPS